MDWDLAQIEKGGFEHFMLKEIFEQPDAVRNAMRGRLNVEEGAGAARRAQPDARAAARDPAASSSSAAAPSWHAGLIGEYMLEEFARIPVEVEYASEFRYRNPIVDEGTLVLVISQSGETIDTLAAMREARAQGRPRARHRQRGRLDHRARVRRRRLHPRRARDRRRLDQGVHQPGDRAGAADAGARPARAACRATTASRSRASSQRIPGKIERDPRTQRRRCSAIAELYAHHNNFIYLGRGFNFPVALEGALKLKEISYIHAEGYPAAEMKHGPIALIDENMPVVFICTRDSAYEKVISNMMEVRARKGRIIAIATEGDTEMAARADHVLYVPADASRCCSRSSR